MDGASIPLSDLSNAPHVCANCTNLATKSCSACRGSPNSEGDLVGPTWYCSSKCQKINRLAHKDICKQREVRKILYRAGSTVEAAFEKYREELFDKSIKAVERDGKNVMLVDSYYDTEDCVFPFPSALFPDKCEKRAVLMFMACNDAYASMHSIIKMLLKGICSKLEEVITKPKDRLFNLTCMSPEGWVEENEGGHYVINATLKDGQQYAVDVTGAQFGWVDPVLPWEQYIDKRVESVKRTMALGNALVLLNTRCEREGWLGKVMRLNRGATQAMDTAIEEWTEINGLSLATMLKLPEAQYLKMRAKMLDVIEGALRSFKFENEDLVRPKLEVDDEDIVTRLLDFNPAFV